MSRVERGLFLVCDGMGGVAGGEIASQMGVETIVGELNGGAKNVTVSSERPDERGFLPQSRRLAEAVRRSNRAIYDQAQKDPSRAKMGTTVVCAWIKGHIASVAHVGDSRAYLWHNSRLDPLTRDHSLVEAHVSAGLLNREESLSSKQQHVLVRVLGREPDVDVDLKEVPVQPGDFLLLCSDGLTRMVSENRLEETIERVRHPQRICDDLVAAADANGSVDNVTVVVVEMMRTWWRRFSNRWR